MKIRPDCKFLQNFRRRSACRLSDSCEDGEALSSVHSTAGNRKTHSCSMQHAVCMDLPLHRRADSTFRISLKMQNADAECRMQNPAQNVYSVCAACRMQDAGSRIGPKMDSSAWCRMQDAECRMQNQTQRVCPSGAAHSFEPDSASCIRILHSASGAKASGFGPDSAFCILHLHPASGAVHSFGADSAFCILHLHPA